MRNYLRDHKIKSKSFFPPESIKKNHYESRDHQLAAIKTSFSSAFGSVSDGAAHFSHNFILFMSLLYNDILWKSVYPCESINLSVQICVCLEFPPDIFIGKAYPCPMDLCHSINGQTIQSLNLLSLRDILANRRTKH